MQEAGVKGYDMTVWFAAYAPAEPLANSEWLAVPPGFSPTTTCT